MSSNIYRFYKTMTSLTPQVLFSKTYKEQCISNIRDLPMFVRSDKIKATAAVLVPLCEVDGEVCLLYTLRSSHLSSHKGQVSFPGGKIDEGESVYDTALRETEEEIGFPPKDVEIWTEMSKVSRDSNMIITPVVGLLNNFDIKKLRPNESEVAEVFTVPVKELCDKNIHGSFVALNINIPVYNCSKHTVWGITGLMTHLLLQCLLPESVYEFDFTRRIYLLDKLMNSKF